MHSGRANWLVALGERLQSQTSLLVDEQVSPSQRRVRLVLFVAWLALVAWFLSTHTFWRDEVRAFSIALSGSNLAEMLHTLHGEGHPALWYLILRGAHDLFPVRQVLPAAGAAIGILTMAVMTRFSPFRSAVVALILFSFWGAFEYIVVARNYCIAALVMFVIAALYRRVRGTLWFGVLLVVLCNTNVPACLLAAIFLLFRLIEMATEEGKNEKRDWLIFAGNAALSLIGALLCFVTVYPTYNDAAVSTSLSDLTVSKVIGGLFDRSGFLNLGFPPLLLLCCCMGLIRRPAAFIAAIASLIGLKLFFFLVYPSDYRHEILYLVFLLSLYWIAAEGAGGRWGERPWMGFVERMGSLFLVALLGAQTWYLRVPIEHQLIGKPFSRSADAGKLLRHPPLSNAIVMADPDPMLEALPYYTNNPLYFLRQQRFGNVVRLSNDARRVLTLDDILADADRLHRQTGRPIIFLSHIALRRDINVREKVMYDYYTVVTPASAERFLASTRLIARLHPSGMDENYDVYLYPR
jgi:hypothetical protein